MCKYIELIFSDTLLFPFLLRVILADFYGIYFIAFIRVFTECESY